MTIVLDADVLIGALDSSDAHHTAARALFTEWRDHGERLTTSVVNLTEVLVAPAAEPQSLRRARSAISAFGIEVHQPQEAIAVDAARLRLRHPISLPDAYCLATARQVDASLASFDARVVQIAGAEGIAVAAGLTPTGRRPRPRRPGGR